MKICCFIDSLGSGGAQRQMCNLAVALKKRKHEVHFLTYRDQDFFKRSLEANHIKVDRLDCKNNIQLIMSARHYLKSLNPDVVISFLQTPNMIAGLASVLPHGWKLVTSERNSKKEIFQGLRGKLSVFAERQSDWKVSNSNKGRLMWEKHCPKMKNKLSTIYNPVIIDGVDQTESCKMVDGSIRRIVVAASYQYTKNPASVVKALSLLSEEERRRLKLEWFGRIEVVKGDTRAYDEASAYIREHDLGFCIELHSETKQIYSEMANADAVGLFSTVEGLPNAICEGMMLGKPILMTPVSDYDTFVTNGNGILCDDYTPEAIAVGLKKFVSKTDDELLKMGKESKAIAAALFNFEKNVDQWEELISRL